MKKIFTLIVMLAATLGMQAQDTWTVAGEKAITGASWDPADASNDMSTEDNVEYTLVKPGMMVKAKAEGGYGYKVVQNHSWDNANYPTDNAILEITEDAEYTITFTFNANTGDVKAIATKTGAYVAPVVGDQTWTVVGVGELCGSGWDLNDESNNMTLVEGTTYKWTKENVALNIEVGYGFKIVADHSWDESYGGAAGGQTSDNYLITVDKPGLYTVEIIFDSAAQTITVNTTWTADHDFSIKTWTIAGAPDLMGSNWDQTDTNNDMTMVEDGLYILIKENVSLLAYTEYGFKVLANHSWTENYGADGAFDGPNVILQVDEDGVYTVTFVFSTENNIVTATPEATSGISTLKAIKEKSNAPIYNLQGQRVDGNYRGIAIQNGRKMIVK